MAPRARSRVRKLDLGALRGPLPRQGLRLITETPKLGQVAGSISLRFRLEAGRLQGVALGNFASGAGAIEQRVSPAHSDSRGSSLRSGGPPASG